MPNNPDQDDVLEQYIKRMVAKAPLLTTEQKRELAPLIRGGDHA